MYKEKMKKWRDDSILRRESDGGPSLSIMTSPANSSPITCKGKLKEVVFQALGMHLDREHHGQPVANSTGTRTTVPRAESHPRCTPWRLLTFLLVVWYFFCQDDSSSSQIFSKKWSKEIGFH